MVEPRTAALYMRMSTERQDFSIRHQRHALEIFAAANSIEVVREYCDEGRSGLGLKGRNGLRRLLDDVVSEDAPFNTVLVYDVSRWGRFQDVDEAAHYEFLCRSAGIAVIYCAEQFENDGSALSSMVKTIKRTMAAEYSRELSAKVFAAQCRFAREGFKQGGTAGLGVRRVSVSADGRSRHVLQYGERKRSITDRVVYAQGPVEEVELVRKIYRWFVHEKHTYTRIAKALAECGVLNEVGETWSTWRVRSVLSNEIYIGNLVFNKCSGKLGETPVVNRPDQQVRYENAFPRIVSRKLFKDAQREIEARVHRWSDDELLASLRAIYARDGRLTQNLIDQCKGNPSNAIYRKRFGSLPKAYALCGIGDTKFTRMSHTRAAMNDLLFSVVRQSMNLVQLAGETAVRAPGHCAILISGSLRLRVVVCRCRYPKSPVPRWRLVLSYSPAPDFILAVQLDETNTLVRRYFLLPMSDCDVKHGWLQEGKDHRYYRYAFPTLEDIFGVCVVPRCQPNSGNN